MSIRFRLPTFLFPLPKMSVAVPSHTPSPRPRALVLAGPTAIGKSATALALAQTHLAPGEIISADSVQVYRHLDIASNKPSAAEISAVPHHCLSTTDPGAPYSAGSFLDDARDALRGVVARRATPIVVGGTMMYLRWVVHGRPATRVAGAAAVARADAIVQEAAGDWEAGLGRLRERDGKRAGELSRNDWYRLRRALQVCEEGAGVGELEVVGGAPGAGVEREERVADFRCFFLVGKRVELMRRIDRRCEGMIWGSGEGVLGEVRDLLVGGLIGCGAGSAARAIGYRQSIGYLLERAEAIARERDKGEEAADRALAFRVFLDEFRTASRGYAKQQMAWFRKEEGYVWVKAGEGAATEIAELYGMGEDEFVKRVSGEEFEERQKEMRADVIAQGKLMKTYISTDEILVRGSEEETSAVALAEKCAAQILDGVAGGLEGVLALRRDLADDGMGGTSGGCGV